jgi:hypothetical protein
MKHHLNNLQKFLDNRGITMVESIKLIVSFGTLLGVTIILIYGAISAAML